MASIELFPKDQLVGVFRGFQQGGLEFHADLVLPYKTDFQNVPMHGQFLLVQLESKNEAVLGRITSFSSDGKLSFGSGEEFNIRAMRDGREVPEDLREDYLKYRVNIRVLGVLRMNGNDKLDFVASHRRLPHVGSPVAFPSGDVLREIAGHNISGAHIGHFALGEYIYYGQAKDVKVDSWMQVRHPEVQINFPISSLVSRRSFVFARAGFGKSNLNKLLFSKLYETTPTVKKRGDRHVPVGTIIFDPDGEYFWPDDKGRPGLCDIPHLQDKVVVFTPRRAPSPFYGSFVVGGIKLDIRSLRPGDVIAIALDAEKQKQQNVIKLRGLSEDRWARLVDLVAQNGNDTPLEDIRAILGLRDEQQDAEALAARSNMASIVRMLHDRNSRLMDMLLTALAEGKLCIVDVSQMRGQQALILSGLILRKIFSKNQEEFTNADPATIPTIAVVEEAQSVLNENSSASEPYVAWVKEGRKYDLGALLITQQPGSIPVELLSQGDNWFIFHLLSSSDLVSVKRANAHFSDDILSSLLNEPIQGQGVFWSSVDGKPYPVPLRIASFEGLYSQADKDYDKPAVQTYAAALKEKFAAEERLLEKVIAETPVEDEVIVGDIPQVDTVPASEGVDRRVALRAIAIRALRGDAALGERLRSSNGAPWRAVTATMEKALPETMHDRGDFAYHLVVEAMNEVFGDKGRKWEAKRNDRGVLYIYVSK